ncbi:MAG: hypothetical protein AVDCRST_MAG87-1632, partial [uncultured Thermomicrobiales bacterium]
WWPSRRRRMISCRALDMEGDSRRLKTGYSAVRFRRRRGCWGSSSLRSLWRGCWN